MKEAISFGEYLKNHVLPDDNSQYWIDSQGNEYTTEELYNYYTELVKLKKL